MTVTLTALQQQRRDTAANWTAANPTLLTGELGYESDTGYWKVGDGSTAWTSLAYIPASKISAYPLVNADIDAAAEIAVSKLANGTANQILTTDGTDVSWTDDPTIAGNVTIEGDLTVNGTTTTIDTQTLVVEDKNIELGNVTTPSDVTADGGGITLLGSTNKTINWIDSTDAWTFSEHVNIASGKEYRIDGTKVLDATSLGSAVVSSSLTSVGTIGTGVWQGTTIGTGYGGTGQTTYTDGQLLIGKTDGTLAKATITQGSGVTITNGDGTITIAATGSGGTVTAVTATSPLASTGGTTPDISIQDGTTAQKGAVQLEDSTSSTSITTAATPNAVKSAYDLANAALPASGGTLTGDVTLNGQSDLRFADSDSSNWVAFQAPATIASNVTWTLPSADGTSGQVLSTDGAGALSWATAAGGATDKIEEGNTSAEVVDTGSDGHFKVLTEGTERARIDSSGRLLVGTSSAESYYSVYTPSNLFTPGVQVKGAFANANFALNSTNDGAVIHLVNSSTSTSSGRLLGAVSFNASDGTNNLVGAGISAFTDATTGTNDMPGRLVFSTTADGASSPTERMRIDNNGHVTIYKDASNLARLHLHNSSTRLEYSDSSGDLTFYTNTTGRVQVGYLGGFRPVTDNSETLGTASKRWTAVYAVNGTIQTSDLREKTNIATSSLGTDFIKQLRPVSYKFKVGENIVTTDKETETEVITPRPGERTHWGFVAQEVKEVVDAAGVDFGGWILTDKDDPDSTQGLRYDQFIAPLTKALQEALEKIETLEAKVAALEAN